MISGGLDKVNSKIPSEKRKEWESLSKEERKERWWNEIRKILKITSREEHIIKGIRQYRDVFSHRIGTSPSVEETILIISGAIILIKKMIELKIYES